MCLCLVLLLLVLSFSHLHHQSHDLCLVLLLPVSSSCPACPTVTMPCWSSLSACRNSSRSTTTRKSWSPASWRWPVSSCCRATGLFCFVFLHEEKLNFRIVPLCLFVSLNFAEKNLQMEPQLEARRQEMLFKVRSSPLTSLRTHNTALFVHCACVFDSANS